MLLVALVVLIGAGLPSARADEFIRNPPNDSTDAKPDDWLHSYCWDGTTFSDINWKSVTVAQMNQVHAQSSYNAFLYGDSQGLCQSGKTANVVFIKGPLTPANRVGLQSCQHWDVDGECDHSFIWFDIDKMAGLLYTTNGDQGVACHEIGHSLGLTHNNDVSSDCMGYATADGNLHGHTYSAHHVGHLQQSHDSPTGNLDFAGGVTNYTGLLRFQGWALDPDVQYGPHPPIQIKIDATLFYNYDPNVWRPDVATEFPFWSSNHGYSIDINTGGGCHTVTVYALNAAYGGATRAWGPQTACSWPYS